MSDTEVKEEDHSPSVSETSSQPTINVESAFEKLIRNINEVGRKTEDPQRISDVIKTIIDLQTEDVQKSITMITERTETGKDQKKQQERPPEIKIILIIKSCNKNRANSEPNDPGSVAGTSTGISNTNLIMNSLEELETSENDQTLMGNFKTNAELIKGVFKYLQPLIMYEESITEIRKNEKKEMSAEFKKLYFIVRTTRNCLCHWRCFFDPTLIRKMYSNIANLYDILGVNLNEKILQKKLFRDNKLETYNVYFYGDGGVKHPNDSKPLREVSRNIINRTIKSLIMRGHSEVEVKGTVEDSYSKFIILFGSLLHENVGTRDTNWSNITGYFAGYEIEVLKVTVNGASSADQASDQKGEIKYNLNITLKRKKKSKQSKSNQEDFFFADIRLIRHWAQMLLRDKDEGADGSNIDEIRRALEDGSATRFGDLFRKIISEKKEKLNKIINLIKPPDQSASADKIDSGDVDVFFKELIDCEKIAYISSADATILNRLIICPLKIQNQWFLIVADRAANFRSLYGCLGNYSVSAPDVQKLCDNFVYDLKELASLKELKKIQKANLKGKNQKGEIKNDPLLSNDPQQTPGYPPKLGQRNKRLTANFTADSNGLIICPLKVQNQWFLFVADCANDRCSLHGCLGNYSVSAPHVQNLCNTFLSNMLKLPSLKGLNNIPQGEPKNQPQNIYEDCDSLICSLAFNLVYCPLHLYPKDVPRIIMAIKMKKNEPEK